MGLGYLHKCEIDGNQQALRARLSKVHHLYSHILHSLVHYMSRLLSFALASSSLSWRSFLHCSLHKVWLYALHTPISHRAMAYRVWPLSFEMFFSQPWRPQTDQWRLLHSTYSNSYLPFFALTITIIITFHSATLTGQI